VPFGRVFAPGHEFKGYYSPGFHWEKWAIIGILALAVAAYVCIRSLVTAPALPPRTRHREISRR
jgi:hypothetical protein